MVDSWEDIQKKVELEGKIRDNYSHFLLKYLLGTSRKVVKITPLTLKLNGFPADIKGFLEKQWTVEFNYVDLIKQRKNYLQVELTDKAYLMADTFEYEERIVRRTYLLRFIFGIILAYRGIKKFFKEIIPSFFRLLFSKKSGSIVMKTIGVLSAILGFIWLCIEMFEWAIRKGLIN